jgi:anti-sigma factor (TIGR02949 family)
MRCADCREWLDGYLDAELTPHETETVAAHLAECPDCAADYAALAATSRQLKEGLMRHSAPDVLRARILGAIAQPAPHGTLAAPWLRWTRLAAAGLVIAIASSGATAAVLRRDRAARAVEDDVLASHVRSLMPGHLTDVASTDQHNVKPWFNGRVDLSPVVPLLDSAGFPLLGGRLDYVVSRPVAAVVYGRRQHVINVYSWPIADDDAPASATSTHGYHLIRWRSGHVESWAVSDLNAAELSTFVALYQRGGG